VSVVEMDVAVDASPERVWATVGDPVALGDLTAECFGMTWIEDSTGPAVGARFRGHNRSSWRRWSTICTIVRFEPGTEIAWDVTYGPLPVARWGYRVEPDGDAGAVVTERFEDHRGRFLRAVGPIVRATFDPEGHNRANMNETLARIKVRAEA
jgi:Polyketide cyclase / dehydrase and lipid transport